MCGITCILSGDGRRIVTEDAVQRMNDSLTHRGPDGEGLRLFTGGSTNVGLGHRRLSIIDLGSGAQPMSNEDGTVWITYNGEVYNHLALREELSALVIASGPDAIPKPSFTHTRNGAPNASYT